jgi:Tfp pilus assembly PilM family ATPase
MLAIEWSNRQLRIVDGASSGESVKLAAAFAVNIPERVDASNPEAVGGFIRTTLLERGIKDRRAVSCIDRKNVVLKVISIANIAEGEIPSLVRLQAMRDLTLPIEETIVDYMRTNPQGESEEPRAVLAVVRNEIVSMYQRVFKAAGLRLEGLWPASLAHVRAAVTATPTMITHAGEEHFLIVPYEDSVELSLLRGTQFLTSASRPTSRAQGEGGETESLMQTVRRLQASLSGQYTDLKVRSVLFAGVENEELTRALTEQFGAEVVYCDPLRTLTHGDIPPSDRGAFAGVVGSLVLAERPADQKINFLSPKKPAPKTDRRRLLAIAAAALLLGAGLFVYQRHAAAMGELDRQIAAARKVRAERRREIRELAPKVEQLAWVEQWREGEAVWLNILRDVVEAMPESGRLFVTRMDLARGTAPRGPRAILQLEGYADDPKTITDANARLAGELGLEVQSGAVQPATRFAGYNWKYSATISVPADYQSAERAGPADALSNGRPRESASPATAPAVRLEGDARRD